MTKTIPATKLSPRVKSIARAISIAVQRMDSMPVLADMEAVAQRFCPDAMVRHYGGNKYVLMIPMTASEKAEQRGLSSAELAGAMWTLAMEVGAHDL